MTLSEVLAYLEERDILPGTEVFVKGHSGFVKPAIYLGVACEACDWQAVVQLDEDAKGVLHTGHISRVSKEEWK